MRCLPSQLKQTLEKKTFPFYVLYGNEPFLIQESATLIKQHLQAQGEVDYNAFTLDSSNFAKFHLNQPSLFAPKQLWEITLGKLSSPETTRLAQLLQDCPENVHLLIHASTIRQKQPPAWFSFAELHGLAIAHWPLSSEQYLKWCQARCSARQVVLPPEALHLLVYQTEGNCLAGAQEIERLRLYYAAGEKHDLERLEQHSQFEVFDLCVAALHHQTARVAKIVSCLKHNEETPIQLILWALSQTLRVLLACHSESREDIQRRLLHQAGILVSVHSSYLQALNKPVPKRWAKLLGSLSQIDKMSKSGEIDAAWRSVLEVCLNLAGPPFFAPINRLNFA